jgi:hypothetical protein
MDCLMKTMDLFFTARLRMSDLGYLRQVGMWSAVDRAARSTLGTSGV